MKLFFTFLILIAHTNFVFAEAPTKPSSISQLDQTWTNQNGKSVSLKDLEGHITIATMVFTSCPSACPLMVSDMKSFDKQLTANERKNVRFVAFSVDPKNDSPEKLLSFYKKMKLNERWSLLTSNEDQVREMAAALGFNYKNLEDGSFTHSAVLYLLSAQGEVLARKERGADWKDFLEAFRAKNKK